MLSSFVSYNSEEEDGREKGIGSVIREKSSLKGTAINEENEENMKYHQCTHHIPSCTQLEHSFSQSDLSHYNVAKDTDGDSLAKLTDLRSDFVHLHGVQLNANSTITDLHSKIEEFRFRLFQGKSTNPNTKVVVVVPSIDLDRKELRRMCSNIEYYEERQLYHLLLANDPSVRIIYITSNKVSESVVRYYLNLSLRHNEFCDMHQMLSRVIMVHIPSDQCIPLSEKVLNERNLVGFLKGLIRSPFSGGGDRNTSAGLSVFTGSDSLDTLSRQLGIRLLEASGDHLHYGTKQGSREIFADLGLPFAKGTPDLPMDDDLLTYGNEYGEESSWSHSHRYIRSSRNLAIGIARQILIRAVHPRKWVIKLNQSFSGKGNASIDLQQFQDQPHISSNSNVNEHHILELATEIEKEFEAKLMFEDKDMTWYGDSRNVGYNTQIERLGVIAESFIEGEVPTSPSIQVVVEPGDEKSECKVSIVSTHEQLLHGQLYQGCINPASENYRNRIMEMGLKVGNYLAERGVVGHFSCDFVATRKDDGQWDLNALEVNLRQGGTTHPHAMMALLCGGCICHDGVFRNNAGETRMYIATDCHSAPNIIGRSEEDIVNDIESKTDPLACNVRWNKQDSIGVVFHLFKFVERHGRIGFTAIGRSIDEARQLYNDAIQFLDGIGKK
jgi:hypothetical protein